MNINAAYDNVHNCPFSDGDRVILLEEHNGKEKGLTGNVEIGSYFWVLWDDGSSSSFNKLQYPKLNLLTF